MTPADLVKDSMQDHGIDLALAVNYLPACSCFFRSVLLSVGLCAVHSVKLVPAFVPICLVLVVHRACPKYLRIFDGSGVLFSIFLSHCVAVMQELGEGWWTLWPPVAVLLSVEWPLAAGYVMYRPPLTRQHLQGCLIGACLHVSAFAFAHTPHGAELRLVRFGRDVAFAGLCLVWTYVVGIYRRRLSRDPAESSSHFAVYFWPVLFVHAYAAAAYAAACFAAICAQLRPADPPSQELSHVVSYSPRNFSEPPSLALAHAAEALAASEGTQADPDDEELFRQAMLVTRSAV